MKKRPKNNKGSDMRPTKGEVIWCYRNLLGREPESEKAIEAHLKAKSLRHLVDEFVKSDEFRSRLGQPAVVNKTNLLSLRKLQIDTRADEHQLRACSEVIKDGWRRLGELKPHYSVITCSQYLPENLNGTIDSFWLSGEREADAVGNTLKRYGFDNTASKSCIEYGCGVGRVTAGLARYFANVSAFDISEHHMDLAKEHVNELGRTNFEWHLVKSVLDLPRQPCDFFYSQIVFQHNPPPVIRHLISWALSCLKPDGVAIFQVPTYSDGYSFEIEKWIKQKDHSDMQMHCIPQSEVFALINEHQCVLLEVREDNRTGNTDKYISNTFAVQRPS